jgi:hypothetical protein
VKSPWLIVTVVGLLVLAGGTVFSQPPEDREPRDGRPPGRRAGPPPNGPRGPWEPGKLMPPHVRHELKLSVDQDKQLADLEKEVKERILKILTEDQKKQLKELRPEGPPPEDRNSPQPPRKRRPAPPDDRRPQRDESGQ